jgi:lipopolysaccharide biosynthesis regulator YciM
MFIPFRWTYELCPGQHVRQYHESTVLDRAKGVASSKVETEYYLGRYDVKIHEAYADEDEWKHVVNVTDTGMLQKKSKSSAGGNGAYFYQEYTQGDFCEDPDGAIGGGGMERASTVRYSCGSALKMTVIEDSTCHYIVQVAIPLLCEHPLFQAPVSKRKVIKCLPALPGSHIP